MKHSERVGARFAEQNAGEFRGVGEVGAGGGEG